MSLGDWFSVRRKGGTGESRLIYTPQRVKTAGLSKPLCVGLAVKSLSRVMVLKNHHLTGSLCSVRVQFVSKELALPKQLDYKCAQNDGVQSHLQPEAGKPYV